MIYLMTEKLYNQLTTDLKREEGTVQHKIVKYVNTVFLRIHDPLKWIISEVRIK